MDRPTLPTLIALVHVHGCQPQAIPLRGLPDWYALAIPAGYPAYVIAPDADLSGPNALADCTTVQLEGLVESAKARGLNGLSYGIWTVRVTRGAWARLAAVKDALVDILNVRGILPMEPGAASVRDRARLFARVWVRRLLAAPAQTTVVPATTGAPAAAPGRTTAGKPLAPRPSYPVVPAAPGENGELKHMPADPQEAAITSAEEPPQEEM